MRPQRGLNRLVLAVALGGTLVLVLSACSSGGVENGKWWLERGSQIGAETVRIDLRVGFVGCAEHEVTPDQIVGHTVEYTATEVVIAVQLDRPRHSNACGGAFASGQPLYTIELEEPLGTRRLMRLVGNLAPSPAVEYNY